VRTSRRIDADDLPNGGAYAILYFRDADGSPVEEKDAIRIEVFEYNAANKPINITFIDVNGGSEDGDDSGA
jgi:hypothetical protein